MANHETTNTFNVEQCNKDINNVRADINRAMHSFRCALERLEKAKACLNESLGVSGGAIVAIDPEKGIKCNAEIHLDIARLEAKYANICAIKSSQRISRIISELYAAGVAPDINDEDDN